MTRPRWYKEFRRSENMNTFYIHSAESFWAMNYVGKYTRCRIPLSLDPTQFINQLLRGSGSSYYGHPTLCFL